MFAEGRSQTPAAVDQPDVTAGSWVRPGGVVLERTFAGALGVGVRDRITLDGKPFRVTGIAVTAAAAPYPNYSQTTGISTTLNPPSSVHLASVRSAWPGSPRRRPGPWARRRRR